MSTKRATIGRTFNPSALSDTSSDSSLEQIFTLSTGRKAVFTLQTIPANEVENNTYVLQETNGRDQSGLTPESLKDITATLRLQQFFPCIGIQREEGIEIIDGSRRRASAILCHTPLNVMVTKSLITADEARKLAKDIQTAKEHNIREVGLRLLALKNTGMSQKEIARLEGLSEAKVTRAIQAALVSPVLVSVFPVQSELGFADYKTLSTLEELLNDKDISLDSLLETTAPEINLILADDLLAEDEIKNRIIKILARETAAMASVNSKDKAVVTNLWSFPDKDRFARKRNKGRMFIYEFNRLSKELQDEIDEAVAKVLQKHLSS
ncbi:chromosome partitioning protein ParB [Kosakonia radicincitans UMEnt01/12]|uniref:ParB family protein n=1 Tax=Kosakonia radicincitans TaxID=283686 RepID=UPI00046181D9|nr:ParB family protein [Kosakonia radicincitans]KDE33138.1 chromosome partitioning protein ParB [Kosakonia radicincitans UMEnt01/12]